MCLGFGNPKFLSYPGGKDDSTSDALPGRQGSTGRLDAITLSTYIPALEILVIDGMGLGALPAMPRDIFRLLDSHWLGDGWEDEATMNDRPSSAVRETRRRRIEFVLNFGFYFSEAIINQVQERLTAEAAGHHAVSSESRRPLPFDVHITHAPRGFWQWKQLQVRDLQDDMWNDFARFYVFGFGGMAASP